MQELKPDLKAEMTPESDANHPIPGKYEEETEAGWEQDFDNQSISLAKLHSHGKVRAQSTGDKAEVHA
jgi:hypothetical protein